MISIGLVANLGNLGGVIAVVLAISFFVKRRFPKVKDVSKAEVRVEGDREQFVGDLQQASSMTDDVLKKIEHYEEPVNRVLETDIGNIQKYEEKLQQSYRLLEYEVRKKGTVENPRNLFRQISFFMQAEITFLEHMKKTLHNEIIVERIERLMEKLESHLEKDIHHLDSDERGLKLVGGTKTREDKYLDRIARKVEDKVKQIEKDQRKLEALISSMMKIISEIENDNKKIELDVRRMIQNLFHTTNDIGKGSTHEKIKRKNLTLLHKVMGDKRVLIQSLKGYREQIDKRVKQSEEDVDALGKEIKQDFLRFQRIQKNDLRKIKHEHPHNLAA